MCTKSLLLSSLIIASKLAIFSGSLPITFCRSRMLKTSQPILILSRSPPGMYSAQKFFKLCRSLSSSSLLRLFNRIENGLIQIMPVWVLISFVWDEENLWTIVLLRFKLQFSEWISNTKDLSSQSSCYFSPRTVLRAENPSDLIRSKSTQSTQTASSKCCLLAYHVTSHTWQMHSQKSWKYLFTQLLSAISFHLLLIKDLCHDIVIHFPVLQNHL